MPELISVEGNHFYVDRVRELCLRFCSEERFYSLVLLDLDLIILCISKILYRMYF